MEVQVSLFTVQKRSVLRINRGTRAASVHLWLRLNHDGVEGWGEASSFSTGGQRQEAEQLMRQIEAIAPTLSTYSPWDRQQIEQLMLEEQLLSGARTAIDLALQDWMGKKLGLPLWKLWGLDCDRIPPTSVTLGLSSPEAAQAWLKAWQERVAVEVIKIELGSPAGMAADQTLFSALEEVAPPEARIHVDAKGGWSLADAITMIGWLRERGVEFVEQPLAEGEEELMGELKARGTLPIFADESCWGLTDIPKLVDKVDGINLKLMKCGGLTEARRMVEMAKACGLQVMLGCYSDSALLNSAAAQLSPLVDYVDLDSHLDLMDDPFVGAQLEDCRLVPSNTSGLGVVRQGPLPESLHST